MSRSRQRIHLRPAKTVEVGEVIGTAIGPAVVLRIDVTSRGYIEALVRAWAPDKPDGAERILTWWPLEGLRVAAADSADAAAWASGEPEPRPAPLKRRVRKVSGPGFRGQRP